MNIFEIYGTGVHNLGAVLMANAAATRLRAMVPGCRIVVGASYGDADARAKLGLGITDDVPGRLAGRYVRWAPANVKRVLGITPTAQVRAVLDASGFAYADAFGSQPAQHILGKLQNPARRGQAFVLLPQAYGPFEDPAVARAARALFQRADLMFARDPQSQEAANTLLGEDKAILSPDFTIGLAPVRAHGLSLPGEYATFVPNFRMLKRQDDPEGAAYLALVIRMLRDIRARGLPVVIVLHSRKEDVPLAHRISAEVDGAQIVTHEDPLVLKGVIAGSNLLIASRFHALVSAMSQGVPCIGLGWAHKYDWLFRDFGCGEFLVDVADTRAASMRLEALLDPAENAALRSALAKTAGTLSARNGEMWARVVALISGGGTHADAAE